MEVANDNSITIACPECGVLIEPNELNLCQSCIASTHSIVDDVPHQLNLPQCPHCAKYLSPPSNWIRNDYNALLNLCTKRILALSSSKSSNPNSLKLKDAKFVWTESHSKRIKVEILLQKDLFLSSASNKSTGSSSTTTLEQKAVCEFVVVSQQCPSCTRSAAQDFWNAVVQVRQKVPTGGHRKTLYYLEQVILKHRAHRDCLNIKKATDGVDLFFADRAAAMTMINFLQRKIPMRYEESKKLKSHDIHNNTYNYKLTYSVEIPPVCKDDVVCLSKTTAQKLGNMGQILVVLRVTDQIHLIDPQTAQVARLPASAYFKEPFFAVGSRRQLSRFIVMEKEYEHHHQQQINQQQKQIASSKLSRKRKHKERSGGDSIITDAQKAQRSAGSAPFSRHHTVANFFVVPIGQIGVGPTHYDDGMSGDADRIGEKEKSRSNDIVCCGGGGREVHARSHLGHLLNEGDTVMGFHLANCNINNAELERLLEQRGGSGGEGVLGDLPDVILVKKVRSEEGGRVRHRKWHLKRLRINQSEAAEGGIADTDSMTGTSAGTGSGASVDELAELMDDLEMDEEMRIEVELHPNDDQTRRKMNEDEECESLPPTKYE